MPQEVARTTDVVRGKRGAGLLPSFPLGAVRRLSIHANYFNPSSAMAAQTLVLFTLVNTLPT